MLEQESLKPCPFCGSTQVLYTTHGQYDTLHTIYCGNCGGGMTKSNYATALSYWNKRA